MSPQLIALQYQKQLYWDHRFQENVVLTSHILKNQYCSIYELSILLAHFYQAIDSFTRIHAEKKLKTEDWASILKTIRLFYIHPEDERFHEIKTTCDIILDEIDLIQTKLKEAKIPMSSAFFEDTKSVVRLFESQA